MKNFILLFSFLISSCMCPAFAQSYVEKQAVNGDNLLRNASFSNKMAGWTLGTGVTAAVNSGKSLNGSYAMDLTLTSVNGTVLLQSVPNCANLFPAVLEHAMEIATSSWNLQLCAMHGTTEMQCWPTGSANTLVPVSIPALQAPSSGACGIKLKTTSSTSGTVTVRSAYVGKSRNIGTVAQARDFGSAKWTGTANCLWSKTGAGSNTMGAFTADSDCPTPTAVLPASAPGTKIPGLTFASIPAGKLKCTATGAFAKAGAVDSSVFFALNDGSTTSAPLTIYSNASSVGVPVLVGEFVYSSTQTNKTIQIFGRTGGNTSATVSIDSSLAAALELQISCEHFPSNVDTVIRPSQAADLLGTVFIEPKSTTCREGSEKLDGGTTTDARLIAFLGSSTRPNWSAVSPRGTGTQSINGRTKTGPTNPGDKQEDQFQGHGHKIPFRDAGTANNNRSNSLAATGQVGSNTFNEYSTEWMMNSGYSAIVPETGVNNGTPRFGTETQGNSVGVTWCIWKVSSPVPLIPRSVVYDTAVKAEGVNGVTNISEGTWVPTVTNGGNVSTTSNVACAYTAVGKNVNVNCTLSATFAVAATYSIIDFSLPKTGGCGNDLAGHVSSVSQTGLSGGVYCDSGTKASARISPPGSGSTSIAVNFSYRIP